MVPTLGTERAVAAVVTSVVGTGVGSESPRYNRAQRSSIAGAVGSYSSIKADDVVRAADSGVAFLFGWSGCWRLFSHFFFRGCRTVHFGIDLNVGVNPRRFQMHLFRAFAILLRVRSLLTGRSNLWSCRTFSVRLASGFR